MEIVSHIYESCKARLIQPWIMKHYSCTKNGVGLRKYKNSHKGQRCFLIGNGPSLRAEDLDRLSINGEISFAFNRIYNIFKSTSWRPTFYISQDEKMLAGCIAEINGTELGKKLIPIQLKWFNDLYVNDALYFNMAAPLESDGEPLEFTEDASKVVFQARTGMYTAAQFAAYMGFTEIFLIGVDHHFQISQNNKGEIIVDNTVKDYFTEKYNQDKQNLYIPNTEKSTLTYIAMKKFCEQRGIKVFNATRGGKLEVFERIDFDRLFQK